MDLLVIMESALAMSGAVAALCSVRREALGLPGALSALWVAYTLCVAAYAVDVAQDAGLSAVVTVGAGEVT